MGALEQMQTASEEESGAVFSGLLLDKRSLLRKRQHLSGVQEQLYRSLCVCGGALKDFFPQFLFLYQIVFPGSEAGGVITESVVNSSRPFLVALGFDGHQA